MSKYNSFQNANNKGADQTARVRRLVCTLVRKPPKTGYLALRPICALVEISMRWMDHSEAPHFLWEKPTEIRFQMLTVHSDHSSCTERWQAFF